MLTIFMCDQLQAEVLGQLPETQACRQFYQFTVQNALDSGRPPLEKDSVFFTDQIIINKDGKNIYGWSDDLYKLNSVHHMWSASKSITTTLMGAALQRRPILPDGRVLTEKTRLRDLLGDQWLFGSMMIQKEKFEQIRIENLINMTTSIKWNEGYETDTAESTFLWMLYGKGRKDMFRFVLEQGFDRFPVGTYWNYSGGNMLLIMGFLKELYQVSGKNLVDHLLFSPLNIRKGFYEADQQDTPVGSSYLHLTPFEMIRIGLLYINNGIWNGERILSEDWIAQAQVPSEGLAHTKQLTPEELVKYKKYVKDEGLHSNRSFWLNQDYPGLDFVHEFPNSPKDMYFAAGHYGQLLIIIPSQKMVIARTGHDKFYWDKIDRLTSKAIACFSQTPEQVITAQGK